ncbi:MAG: hypothetical protein MUO61_05610 [Dehalococcoidia bacterium]|nr:hypothetical protein [Dehalococcoidia bacterium]
MDGDRLECLGAIEGDVDKLVANGMKKRGMSWTISGAQGMARLIRLRKMEQLHSWINREDKLGVINCLGSRLAARNHPQGKTPQTGLKMACQLYMDHSKIAPGFKFSGH